MVSTVSRVQETKPRPMFLKYWIRLLDRATMLRIATGSVDSSKHKCPRLHSSTTRRQVSRPATFTFNDDSIQAMIRGIEKYHVIPDLDVM